MRHLLLVFISCITFMVRSENTAVESDLPHNHTSLDSQQQIAEAILNSTLSHSNKEDKKEDQVLLQKHNNENHVHCQFTPYSWAAAMGLLGIIAFIMHKNPQPPLSNQPSQPPADDNPQTELLQRLEPWLQKNYPHYKEDTYDAITTGIINFIQQGEPFILPLDASKFSPTLNAIPIPESRYPSLQPSAQSFILPPISPACPVSDYLFLQVDQVDKEI
jgi:hypothetical protein